MTPRTAIRWVLAIAWAAYIFWMSTEPFGSEHTKPLVVQLLEFVHITLPPTTLRLVHIVCRKLAHMWEYAVFAFLLYRSLQRGRPLTWQVNTGFTALLVCAAYSASDEVHQIFVAGRGPSVIDCCIDILGALFALLFIYRFANSRRPALDASATLTNA